MPPTGYVALPENDQYPRLVNMSEPFDWDFSKDDGTPNFVLPIVLDQPVQKQRSVAQARLRDYMQIALALNQCGVANGRGKVFWCYSNTTARSARDAGTVTLLYQNALWTPQEIEILNSLPNQQARIDYFAADARLIPEDIVFPLVHAHSQKDPQQTDDHWPMTLKNSSILGKTWIIYLSGIHRILVARDDQIQPRLSQSNNQKLGLKGTHVDQLYTCKNNTELMHHLDRIWYDRQPCLLKSYRDVINDQGRKSTSKYHVQAIMREYQNKPEHMAAWFQKDY